MISQDQASQTAIAQGYPAFVKLGAFNYLDFAGPTQAKTIDFNLPNGMYVNRAMTFIKTAFLGGGFTTLFFKVGGFSLRTIVASSVPALVPYIIFAGSKVAPNQISVTLQVSALNVTSDCFQGECEVWALLSERP